MRERKTYK